MQTKLTNREKEVGVGEDEEVSCMDWMLRLVERYRPFGTCSDAEQIIEGMTDCRDFAFLG